ncbi:hypothetical protein [Rhodopila sp.]|uniref:hypothetical protein n=1 Tax=Rhodopila sp. TaxID=2480087 RepID=UPI003D0A8C3F
MMTSISDKITFGRGGNARPHQLYGWNVGEDGFTWTLRHESALSLPKPRSIHGGFVEIMLLPLTRPSGPKCQRVRVRANGEPLGETRLASPALIGFYFHAQSKFDDQFVITIEHPDRFKQSPEADAPDFAVAVKSIRVLDLQEPLAHSVSGSSHVWHPDVTMDDQCLIAAAEEVTGFTVHELMTSFQLVAGDCEFGGVQRACGSDPLGLFRFAGASPFSAVEILDSKFDGIGQDLDPYVAEHGNREWMIRDRRYGLGYHTRMSANEVSREQVTRAEKRKVSFLCRLFLEELDARQKIFVCADRFDSPPEAMLPLFLALSRYGQNTLLWITRAVSAHQVGSVEEVLPGLMRGYIDRFTPHAVGSKPSLSGWLSVLTNAWLLNQRSPYPCTAKAPEVGFVG